MAEITVNGEEGGRIERKTSAESFSTPPPEFTTSSHSSNSSSQLNSPNERIEIELSDLSFSIQQEEDLHNDNNDNNNENEENNNNNNKEKEEREGGEGEGKGTIKGAILNLANTILGAGMLGIPFAFHSTGLMMGVMMIGGCGILSAFGLYLLSLVSSDILRHPSYSPSQKASFNLAAQLTYPSLAIVIDMAIVIKSFGVATSYLIVIGDLMPVAMKNLFSIEEESLFSSRAFWITFLFLFLIPLSSLNEINKLRYTSGLALITVVYLVALTVGFYFYDNFYHNNNNNGEEMMIKSGEINYFSSPLSLSFLTALPLFVFSFACHQNLFPIYNEMKGRSIRRISVVIGVTIPIVFIVYLLIGIFGYLSFLDCIHPNLITNYSEKSKVVTIGRIMITILVLFSYPLQIFPCRYSLDKIIVFIMIKIFKKDEKNWEKIRFWLETFFLLLFTYLVASFVTGLDLVFGMVGATGSTTICYILPGIFYYKLNEKEKMNWIKASGLCLSFFGVIFMIICVSAVLYSYFSSSSSSLNPSCDFI